MTSGNVPQRLNQFIEEGPFSRATYYRAINEGLLEVRYYGKTPFVMPDAAERFYNSCPVRKPKSDRSPKYRKKQAKQVAA